MATKTTKKAVKKAAKKQTPPTPPAKAMGKEKRKPNAAFMAPMLVTEALQAIVGTKPLARTEITKSVWGYIKANGCQDATDKRMINPSGLLIPVIGSEPVSMFKMTALISKHILGKVTE